MLRSMDTLLSIVSTQRTPPVTSCPQLVISLSTWSLRFTSMSELTLVCKKVVKSPCTTIQWSVSSSHGLQTVLKLWTFLTNVLISTLFKEWLTTSALPSQSSTTNPSLQVITQRHSFPISTPKVTMEIFLTVIKSESLHLLATSSRIFIWVTTMQQAWVARKLLTLPFLLRIWMR